MFKIYLQIFNEVHEACYKALACVELVNVGF